MGISISPHSSPNTVYFPEEVTSIKETLDRLGVQPPNFEYCNSVRLTHGPTPSKCYFLLRKSEFVELRGIAGDKFEKFGIIVNIAPDAPIKDSNGNFLPGIPRYKNWSVTDARVILGHIDNPNSIILLTIEDVRYWMGRYSCWMEFQESPTGEFVDSYNVLRHTPKIYNGYAEDLVEKTAELNGYYFYKHTLKGSLLNNSQNTSRYELWNAKEIVEKTFNYWSSNILQVNDSVDASILADLHPMNLCVSQLSYLGFLTKLAEISKTYYYVNSDGKVVFGESAYSYDATNLDYGIENMLNTVFKEDCIFVVKEHCFYYSNNESDAIDRRFHIIGLAQNSSIDLNPANSYPFSNIPGQGNLIINVPHLVRVRDTHWNNTQFINNYITTRIAPRIANMEQSEKTLLFRGVQIQDPMFGADVIVYGNFGSGTHTTVIGVPEYDINYYNAKFEDYYSQPVVEYWRYVQTGGFKKPEGWDLEEPDPAAPVQPDDYKPPSLRVYNPNAPCRLYYPANNKKVKYRISPQEPEGVEVVVEDPLGTHINDPEGTKGVCVQVGQRFFVVESIAKKYYTWTLLSTWTLEPNLGVWYALATLHDLANDKIVQENAIIYDRLKMFTDQLVGDRGYCYYQPEMPDDPNISSIRPGQPLEYWAVNAPCEHWTGYD